MDVDLFPRMVGNPHQYLVKSRSEFLEFVRLSDGIGPCFTSHNSYPEVDDKPIPEPRSVIYQCTPFDFDRPEERMQEALDDVRKLSNYWTEWGIEQKCIFSGGHGFHNYPQWKPLKVDVSSVPKAQGLKRIIRAIQIHAVKELGLKSMDGRIIGDYRRLMRIPGTKWVGYRRTPEGERTVSNGRYCFRIHPQSLQGLSLSDIFELSRAPPRYGGPPLNPGLTFLEYIKEADIDVAKYEGLNGSMEGTYAPIRDVPPGLLKQFIPKPCLQIDLMSEDPRHLSRVDSVIYLRQLGFPEGFIVSFVHDLSEQYGWVDRFNLGVTEYQVHQIAHRRPAYIASTCRRLKQEGLCIGPACHLYFKAEGDPESLNVHNGVSPQ